MADRILVVGGTGLVGNALVRAWEKVGAEVAAATYHCHPSPAFRRLDMQDEPAVRETLERLGPSFVAIPAANPNVDYIEQNPAETRRLNVDGTLSVSRAAKAVGARVLFFSSDYVYDGKKGRYDENDPPTPINEYGRQKAETEAAVLALDPRNLVVRTSGAYGWQWEPKNFVLQVRARLSAGQPVRVAADIRYNPTAAENLAEIVVALVAAGKSGIYHVVGSDSVLRADFAREIARIFGLDGSRIEQLPYSELRSPTPRPESSVLLTEKVRAALPIPLWGVREGLERMRDSEAAWREYAKKLPESRRNVLQ